MTSVAYFMMKYLRGKRATFFGNIKTLQRTHGYKIFHISIFVLVIKMILIILLYMVATDSVLIRDYQPISNTDYVLLIDDSSSMSKSDYKPNRLTSAKQIALQWIDVLGNSTRVSIVAFSRDIDYSTPLITNRQELRRTIEAIDIDYTRSGTNVDFAIDYALDILAESEANKTILMMTDGTEGVTNATLVRARDRGVKIVIFGIGNNAETQTNLPQELNNSYDDLAFNPEILQQIAEQTGGESYEVSDEEQLQRSFNEATLKEVQVSLDSGYYVALLIAIMSIFELLIYAKLGAL